MLQLRNVMTAHPRFLFSPWKSGDEHRRESRANGILALVTRSTGASEISVLSSDLDNDSQASDPSLGRFGVLSPP